MPERLTQIRPRRAFHLQQSQELLRAQAANELVFALVGHVGSGTTAVAKQLATVLTDPNLPGGPFEVEILKAHEQIEAWARKRGEHIGKDSGKRIATAERLQGWGDGMRAEHEDQAVIARRLINEIRLRRATRLGMADIDGGPVMPDGKRRAYILDAVRHPAEIHLLRRVYQNAFALLGVVCDEQVRGARIANKFEDAGQADAQRFMERDARAPEKYGQRVSDAFHLADVFLDNSADRVAGNRGRFRTNEHPHIPDQLSRLVNIITHGKIVRPTNAETAMYHAYGAQMRSACLSRQVGAALVDQYGNLVATGTNEVPRAGGGVHGELFGDSEGAGDPIPEARCAYREHAQDWGCKNHDEQNKLLDDLMGSLLAAKLVPEERMAALRSLLRESPIRRALEFSRAVHAEMDALLAAARQGVSPKGTRLFVTTFPCHYCARHIVSAGVDEVQYIESYPKSQAFEFHADSITRGLADWIPPSKGGAKVRFRPFTGVAPRMYGRAFFKDRPLKNEETGMVEIGQPAWGSVWDLGRMSYIQLEAELSKDTDRPSSEE